MSKIHTLPVQLAFIIYSFPEASQEHFTVNSRYMLAIVVIVFLMAC